MGQIRVMRLIDWYKRYLFATFLLHFFSAVLPASGEDGLPVTATNIPEIVTGQPDLNIITSTNSVETYHPDKNELIAEYISPSNRWDRWHRQWSSNVVGAANYLDRFFGENQLEYPDNKTRLELTLGIKFKEYESPEFIHKGSLRLALPRLSEKLELVVDGIFEPDDPLEGLERTTNEAEESDTDAALRYNIWEELDINLNADVGVRIGSSSQAYLKLRGNRDFEFSPKLQLRLIQTARWFTRDGFVLQSEIQWNKRMGWDWLLRSSSQVEWREDRSGFRPSQVFSVFKTLSRHRVLRLDVGGTWPESPKPVDRLYHTRFTYRQLIHRNWLYMELKPGVEFYEPNDYEPRMVFTIQFEVLIGSIQQLRE